MKNITKYIYEKLKIQADNSSACVYAYNIDKFKSEEICKALDAIREYVNKNIEKFKESIMKKKEVAKNNVA